jgi:hypothetical protein
MTENDQKGSSMRRLKTSFTRVIVMLLAAVGMLLPTVRPVHAQSAVVDFVISGLPGNANVGDTFTVTVQAQAGTQTVNVAKALLTFDTSILQAVSVTSGTALDYPLLVFGSEAVAYNNTAGTVDYEAGKLGDSVSGTFTLFTVEFEAVGTGDATIAFTLSETTAVDAGTEVLRSATGGSVTVSQATANLTGTVTLQSWQGGAYNTPLTVDLYAVGASSPSYQFTPTATGTGTASFTVSGITPGEYEVAVKTSAHLQRVKTVTLTAGNNSADFGELLGGDASNDNTVNFVDFSILTATWELSDGDGSYDARANFNGDSAIDLLDFSIMSSNWEADGETPSGVVTN